MARIEPLKSQMTSWRRICSALSLSILPHFIFHSNIIRQQNIICDLSGSICPTCD